VGFSYRERQQLLHNLKTGSEVYDLLIVGGGITGAGIAREAALRGLKTLLVEKNDFAFGTSSRSSKLVHGGVRYLENYEFHLVFESTQERALLWKNCPQLCQPLPFIFPAFTYSRVPLWKLNLGLWLYDILASFKVPSLHQCWRKKKALEKEPLLKAKDLTGAIFYWDGATDDARLTLANAIDAHNSGAHLATRTEVTSVIWSDKVSEGEAHTAKLRDVLSGEDFEVRARCIVSATGPWTDLSSEKMGSPSPSPLLAATRGSHIVVDKAKVPVNNAVVILHPQDQRVLFAIPWGDFTILGTTDIFDKSNPDDVAISPEEIDYLIAAAKDYFPGCTLQGSHDVVSVWSGLRPLLKPPASANEGQVSREHHIEWKRAGFLIVAGGKLTTYRKMAEDVVLKILSGTSVWPTPLKKKAPEISTKKRPLPFLNFPRAQVEHPLGKSEGARFDLSDIAGMCREQMVLSLEDLLVRRTHAYYKERDHGLSFLPAIKETLCRELEWNDEEWSRQVAAYEAFLAARIQRR
jgi:glycerol-3-phosphate dehydrogenase